MKLKILAIMLTLVMLISSSTAIVATADEICGIQSENNKDPSEIVEVTKKIQSGENWVDELEADLGSVLKFKISITYHDSDGPGGPAYKIKNIVVIDRLPHGLIPDLVNLAENKPTIDGNNLTWDLQGVELFDNQTYEIEFEAVVSAMGDIVNHVEVNCLEKCISVERHVSTSATIHATCSHDYVLLDVDDDEIDEMAIDFNDDSSDGYEVFYDPDYPDTFSISIRSIDGDNDRKIDHFIKINYNIKKPEDLLPDRYWDPDDGILSDVDIEDVDYDGTLEWVYDSDGDSTPDRYYDPDDHAIHLYSVYELDISTNGNGTVIVDPDGTLFLKDFEVELTALPDEGANFDHWGGDISGDTNPVAITMNEDKTITAYFKGGSSDNNTTEKPNVKIVKPRKFWLYKDNLPIRPRMPITKIIGPITIKVKAKSDKGIDRVEFYINGKLKHTEYNKLRFFEKKTYRWLWVFKPVELRKTYLIKVIAYDKEGNNNTDQILVKRVRYHPILHHPLISVGIGGTIATGAGIAGAATAGGLFFLIKNIFNRNKGAETSDNNTDNSSSDTQTNTEPIARIFAPSSGTVGEPTEFDASDSYDPDGSSTLRYNWDFGDGTTGYGINPEHTYTSPGKYKVTLKVTDSMGGESTASMTIQIDEKQSTTQNTDLFWYIVLGLSLILLAIIGLLFVGRKIYE